VKKDSKVKEEYMKLERYIDERVADAVSVELEKVNQEKEKVEQEKAKVEQEKEKAEAETTEVAKGMIETCKDFGASREVALEKLMRKCNLPEEKAEAYLKKFW
jgi:uncharacterized protein (DUF3084 family)